MPAKRPRLQVQYLGVPGVTNECIKALVTILTSPYPCREITILFCKEHEHPLHEEQHYSASFVAWDWLDSEVTIVPDGFGTHGGTGGWGLALALELIRFHAIPLKEKWIVDAEQFHRINRGTPTGRDLKDLRQSEFGAPSWPAYMRNFGSRLWLQVTPHAYWRFPYWLLEPELWENVKGIEEDGDTATFRAVKRLEVVIRQLSGLDARLVGEELVNQAMREGGKLTPLGATSGEIQAWSNLFRGVMGAFKNPQSHRDVKLTIEDAAAQVLTVNLLIRKLRADFPDKIPTNVESVEAEES